MRLKQLKLAGFKSFVEPTVIPFPSQLVAVVGPNGCGKSNIIDAVRWVMGESSAKNLRGESMIDVIFNGSSNRKPVGQASVELVFDNSLGRLSGQYASYQEVAVKRLVTRDGDSTYFLNGTRCRRRDINDLFLGTGAGARGYAIIGQDMISKIIEARPEDLKTYLEEAAGVSKYKERKKETLQRINNTRENLERVHDICDELGKQLARLERQAKAAERYQHLKEEERRYKAEILALKWSELNQNLITHRQNITQSSTVIEEHKATVSAYQNELVQRQDSLQAGNQEVQVVQQQYYQIGTDIARLEESIQQKLAEKNRISAAIEEVERDLKTASERVQFDKAQLAKSNDAYKLLQQSLISIQEDYDKQLLKLKHLQAEANQNQEAWETFLTRKNRVLREAELTSLQLKHLSERKKDSLVRLEALNQEQHELEIEDLEQEVNQLINEERSIALRLEQVQVQHQSGQNQIKSLRTQITEQEQQLRIAQAKAQQIATEYASLTAAQQAAIQAKNESCNLPQWQDKPRMIDEIQVEDAWQYALELALGDSIQGIIVGTVEEAFLNEHLTHSAVLVVKQEKTQTHARYPRLIDKMNGPIPNWIYPLQQIYAAEHLEDALRWLPSLSEEQSVITADGIWMGRGWIKIAPQKNTNETSLLTRQKALASLEQRKIEANDNVSELHNSCTHLHDKLNQISAEVASLKDSIFTIQDKLHQIKAIKDQKQKTLEERKARQFKLRDDIETLTQVIESLAEEAIQAEDKAKAFEQECCYFNDEEQLLLQAKKEAESSYASSQHQLEAMRKLLGQTQSQHDREALLIEQHKTSITREELSIESLKQKQQELSARHRALNIPEETLRQPLIEKTKAFNELEVSLSNWRETIEELQRQISDINQAIKQEESFVQTLQESLQQKKLEEQALHLRREGYVESLSTIGLTPEEVLQAMTEETSLAHHESVVKELEEKIKRLGAINLVAIEEYQTELERKQHLDRQHQDLSEALNTLEKAIAKMDEETTTRLKATFDQVNESFQMLFPRLFGGGRAKLELTCDNLLEAGVMVIAQPPGKRNSTIHMLSGGEKAMTAVALVFAIFQLNPAPFCMLDEVDAPLDDANVRRFCALVKEMSHCVQFLFITHNKVTMELADQLIGVTMREPGVSRIVAVDVEEALSYSTIEA
ncbi:chromosome segregation protein SMC [Legionella yabuuchiae]|uniref:chromosome segregation protein SMC n=1 Tax=Legionella yabuuchiae TaxID=376727 RepID=UPI001054E206|nr:chromosome segregation protein SMC [Legionella yabuuchiae]